MNDGTLVHSFPFEMSPVDIAIAVGVVLRTLFSSVKYAPSC